jgi:lantibiotic modifying enzyme
MYNKKWQPILDGPGAEEIFEVIGEIANALHHPPAAWIPREKVAVEPYRIARGASLAHGSAGIALFYSYLSLISNANPLFADEADRFLSHACDALEEVSMDGGLYRGLSGIAWTVQHLQDFFYENETDDPETDPNIDIDRLLLDHWSKPEKFDLWEGCVGLGVYALERYPRHDSKILLELLVEQLDRLATDSDKGISWFTSARTLPQRVQSTYPNGFYALGIAHGIAGVISFLSRVHALGILPGTTGKLLEGAVSWLLAQKQSGPGLLFPQLVLPPGNTPLTTGTFGWCHGDLGLAAALISAAGHTGEPSWRAHAIEAAHAAAGYLNGSIQKRTYAEAVLCHGTAGLGHLFNRIYQASGIERFREEARQWFKYTLSIRKPGNGIAGFSKLGMNEDGELVEQYDPGFIQGAAGVGLALLAAATGIEPSWDRVMLISN